MRSILVGVLLLALLMATNAQEGSNSVNFVQGFFEHMPEYLKEDVIGCIKDGTKIEESLVASRDELRLAREKGDQAALAAGFSHIGDAFSNLGEQATKCKAKLHNKYSLQHISLEFHNQYKLVVGDANAISWYEMDVSSFIKELVANLDADKFTDAGASLGKMFFHVDDQERKEILISDMLLMLQTFYAETAGENFDFWHCESHIRDTLFDIHTHAVTLNTTTNIHHGFNLGKSILTAVGELDQRLFECDTKSRRKLTDPIDELMYRPFLIFPIAMDAIISDTKGVMAAFKELDDGFNKEMFPKQEVAQSFGKLFNIFIKAAESYL